MSKSFFKTSTNVEDVKASNSAYITTSGFYPVTILAPIVNVSDKGSTSVDFYVEHEGQKQVIYGGVRITNNNGEPNKIGSKLFNQLLVIAGVDEVAEPIEVQLPVGKQEAMKTVSVLEELADMDVIMRIQLEYGMYNGNITEKKNIRAFFRDDKASAEEVLSGEDIGTGYERDAKYANNITYNDEVTPEQVQAWIAGGRNKGAGAAPKAKAPSFGSRKFGEK